MAVKYKTSTHKQQTDLLNINQSNNAPQPKECEIQLSGNTKQLSFEEFKERYEPDEYTAEELEVLYQKAIRRRK